MKTIEEKATQIVAAAQVITLASIDKGGYPRPVPMVKIKADTEAIYVSTGTSSAKTAHFKANPKAGMSIVEGCNGIAYTGIVEIVTDEALKHSLWADWMLSHFPGGKEDPEFCVLKFIPQLTTYWIDNEFVKPRCQSCGMPLEDPAYFGTHKDGSTHYEYCSFCYKDGAFTSDCTMDEMIAHCVKYLGEFNGACNTQFTEEQAIAEMKKHFPHLKRWRNEQS